MKHLLGICDLSRADIEHMFDLADHFAEVSRRRVPKVPSLQGRTITWLFYEDSTRTRLSFELAAKRLSADTLNFSVSSSSVNAVASRSTSTFRRSRPRFWRRSQ